MPIFSDALLNQLTIDAQQEIDKDLQCLFYRFGMATTIGTSVLSFTVNGKKCKKSRMVRIQIGRCDLSGHDVIVPRNGRGILRQHVEFSPSLLLHASDKSL